MKKDKIILIVLIIFVLAIILSINILKKNESPEEQIMKCISKDSKLIISKTCGNCINQIKILEKNLDYFEVLYIGENPEINQKYQIKRIPTWIIKERVYPGVKTIEELKKLTNC